MFHTNLLVFSFFLFPCFLDESPPNLYCTRINMEYIYVSYIVLSHCHCFPFLQIYNVLCSTVASLWQVLCWNTYYTICELTCLVVMFFFCQIWESTVIMWHYYVLYSWLSDCVCILRLSWVTEAKNKVRLTSSAGKYQNEVQCHSINAWLIILCCDSYWCDIWSMCVIGIFASNCFFSVCAFHIIEYWKILCI